MEKRNPTRIKGPGKKKKKKSQVPSPGEKGWQGLTIKSLETSREDTQFGISKNGQKKGVTQPLDHHNKDQIEGTYRRAEWKGRA